MKPSYTQAAAGLQNHLFKSDSETFLRKITCINTQKPLPEWFTAAAP